MTPVAQALIFVGLGVSLSRESPYYPVEGTIEEVSYRLAGKTVDDDVHTLLFVAKVCDVPVPITVLSVVTLHVRYAYVMLPMLMPVVMCAFMVVWNLCIGLFRLMFSMSFVPWFMIMMIAMMMARSFVDAIFRFIR